MECNQNDNTNTIHAPPKPKRKKNRHGKHVQKPKQQPRPIHMASRTNIQGSIVNQG
jgi:hypothetical protein